MRGAGTRRRDAMPMRVTQAKPSIQATDGGASPEPTNASRSSAERLSSSGRDYTPPKPEAKSPEPFALELRNGSDARDETKATVALALANRSNRARHIYFRREFVSFEVSGPDGVTICDPEPDGRAPNRQAFPLLNPGGSLTTTSRLVELCPDERSRDRAFTW